MSVNIPLLANTKTVCLGMATTSAVDIYTGQQQLKGTLESLSACNYSGTAADFTLQLFDGTNTFKIYGTKSVAAKDTLFVKDHSVQISSGWTLQAVVSSASAFNVVAVIAEVSSVRSQ